MCIRLMDYGQKHVLHYPKRLKPEMKKTAWFDRATENTCYNIMHPFKRILTGRNLVAPPDGIRPI